MTHGRSDWTRAWLGPADSTRRDRPAFTLIEVLVVAAIVGLLLAILLPSLSRAKEQAKAAVCLNNQRQMAVASHAYTSTYASFFPPSQDTVYVQGPSGAVESQVDYGWDVTRITDLITGRTRAVPGLIWQGHTIETVHQCPSFNGAAMWADDRYTGYNYNSSYVGAFRKKKERTLPAAVGAPAPVAVWVVVVPTAKQDQIRTPARCAVFGDGQYASGANKFMRSPWGSEQGARDTWLSSGRGAGTQGFRHWGRTNVAFADGHAQSWRDRCTDTYDEEKLFIGDSNGFLCPDNSLYDLK